MRWGITLRHRVESVEGSGEVSQWTVKLPEDAGGIALVRHELSWPGPFGPVPPQVASLVRAAARRQPLGPVASLNTQRRRVELSDAGGTRLAEVDDDIVSVMDGDKVLSRFREVEVELTPEASPDLLKAILECLVRAGAVEGDNRPKVVRAIGPRAEQGPDVVIPKVGPHATVAQVVAAAIASALTRIIRHDPGVRLGDDPEHVHQARVGTRRLRSDLRTFGSLLDAGWLDRIRSELRWVGNALGEVRDADVLSERLRADIATLPPIDSRAAGGILRRLASERDEARGRVLEVLDSDRYVTLLEDLTSAAADPPVAGDGEGGARRAADVLPSLVHKRWKSIKRAVESLGEDPPDPALHQVRIQAKRLRYAAEAAAGVIGPPARNLASAIAKVQTVLGDHQDAVVAEGWLRKFGSSNSASPNSMSQALVAGELVALQRQRQQETRAAWTKPWKAASRPRLRAWLKS
jgi:CHAD domain-containing protein